MDIEVQSQVHKLGNSINHLASSVFSEVGKNLEAHRSGKKLVWSEKAPGEYLEDLIARTKESSDEAAFLLSAYTYCEELTPKDIPLLADLVTELVTISILNVSEKLKLNLPPSGLLSLIALNPILYYPDGGTCSNH